MTSRRREIEMAEGEIGAFLARGRTAVLVTIGPDGLPDPVPMWYVLDAAGALVMRTYAKSQKVVNLRRDPRVAVLVEDGERYAELRGVQLTGSIELSEDVNLIADTMVGLMVKYEGLAEADVAAARAAALTRAPKMVALRLRVDRVVSWDHGRLAS